MKMNFLKKEKHFKKEKENFWLDMNFSWRLAICFVLAVMVISSLGGYLLARQINQEPAPPESAGNSQVDIVKKERIEKVLRYFSARRERSAQIQNSPAPVSDPSL